MGGGQIVIVYDDQEPTEKIKIYDKGHCMNHDPEQHERMLARYRNGDMLAPNLDGGEALRLMARALVSSITEKRAPLSKLHPFMVTSQVARGPPRAIGALLRTSG